MKTTKLLVSLVLGATLLTACSHRPESPAPAHRGVYHWKTTYAPTDWELQWMKRHKVDRLYIKLFDVQPGILVNEPSWAMVPVATTVFKQKLPKEMDVVPVVYITVEAIRKLDEGIDNTERYASLIVKRIDDMMAEYYDGTIREVQLDCDWTEKTHYRYFRLAEEIRQLLHQRNILLSGTLRLHQLREVEPQMEYDIVDAPRVNELVAIGAMQPSGKGLPLPFDRTLLMCYNTGRLQQPDTRNSILDYKDVAPYLAQYRLPSLPGTDVAYPVYGWGVAFDAEGHFQQLVHSHALPKQANHTVRIEWGEPEQIHKVQRALPALDSSHTTVLYHLDSLNLSKYSNHEVEMFYSR